MLRRLEKEYSLYAAPSDYDEYGEAEDSALIGNIRAALSHSTLEETDEDDIERATESAIMTVRGRFAPAGGFVRGMTLVRGGAVYFIKYACRCGRLWVLKVSRSVTDGSTY